jgi:hypothetical protein
VIGSLDGGGELDLNLGGAQTTIDDTYYRTPSIGSPAFLTTEGAVAGASARTQRSDPSTVEVAPAAGVIPVTQLAVRQDASCHTTSGVGHPMCWAGHAAAGAIAVAAFTVALLAADEALRRRRSQRRAEVAK